MFVSRLFEESDLPPERFLLPGEVLAGQGQHPNNFRLLVEAVGQSPDFHPHGGNRLPPDIFVIPHRAKFECDQAQARHQHPDDEQLGLEWRQSSVVHDQNGMASSSSSPETGAVGGGGSAEIFPERMSSPYCGLDLILA